MLSLRIEGPEITRARSVWLGGLLALGLLLHTAPEGVAQQRVPREGCQATGSVTQPTYQPGSSLVQPRGTDIPAPLTTPYPPPTTVRSVPARQPIELRPRTPGQLFELDWGADVTEEYSDNFTFATSRAVDNYRTLFVPKGTLLMHTPFMEAVLAPRLGVAWDTSTQKTLFLPNVVGQICAEVTPRWTLILSGSYAQTDSPEATDALGVDVQRVTNTRTTFGQSSSYAFTTLTLRQSYRWSQFEQDAGNTTTVNSFGAGASLLIAQINTLRLDYSYSLSETKSGGTQGTTGTGTQTTSGDQKTNNDGGEIVASLSREVSERWVAGVAANYSSRTSKQSGGGQDTTTTDFSRYGATVFSTYTLPSFVLRGSFGITRLKSGSTVEDTVFSTNTALKYFAGPLTLDASLESGFADTFAEGGQNFGVVKSQGGAAGAAYAFTPRLIGRVGASYRVNEQTGIGGGTSDSKNEVFTGTASLDARLLDWLAIRLNYRFTNNRPVADDGGNGSSGGGSGTSNGGYKENRVGVSFTFDF